MTKTARRLVIGLVMAGVAGAPGRPAAAETLPSPMPRVRSTSPSLMAAIARATEQSATFRGLVQTIASTDGIVYVEAGRCGHGVVACLAAVSPAEPHRLVWVKVDTQQSDSDLMSSIGHELQHAVEVLRERAVRNSTDMYFFYSRGAGGRRSGGAFETTAATNAGIAIWTEVRKSQSRGTNPSLPSPR